MPSRSDGDEEVMRWIARGSLVKPTSPAAGHDPLNSTAKVAGLRRRKRR